MTKKMVASVCSFILFILEPATGEVQYTKLDTSHENGLGEWTCSFRQRLLDMEEIPVKLKDEIDRAIVEWAWGYMTGKNTESSEANRKKLELIGDGSLLAKIVEGCDGSGDLPLYAIVEDIYRNWPTEQA